jgi:hypothetical protein
MNKHERIALAAGHVAGLFFQLVESRQGQPARELEHLDDFATAHGFISHVNLCVKAHELYHVVRELESTPLYADVLDVVRISDRRFLEPWTGLFEALA